MNYNTALTFLPILDITQKKDLGTDIYYEIIKTTHKFTSNSVASGNDPVIPIFGSNCWIKSNKNIEQKQSIDFGLPVIKVRQNQQFNIVQKNLSTFAINIHFHGVNFNPYNDGASSACIFGPDTEIGLTNKSTYIMNNNSCLCWYHPHNMLNAAEYVYTGMVGLMQVVDSISKNIDDLFINNDNYLVLMAVDININSDGTLNKDDLYTDEWRGSHCAINGTSCVDWNNDEGQEVFIEKLYHETTNNIVKISILNGNCSWRTYFIGVCDSDSVEQDFYNIQTDIGYRNPIKTKSIQCAPGTRVSFMFDLNDFTNKEAYIFYYSYDLTENNGLVYFDELENPVENSGETIYEIYPCGVAPIPLSYTLKKFIKIKLTTNQQNNIQDIVTSIKKIVFGCNYKKIIGLEETQLELNYWKYLNPKYYYNLPDFNFDCNIPQRNFVFFGDSNSAQILNQSTEYFDGQNRIFVDMWNSYDYDMWIKTYNHKYLPGCKFKISKYTDGYLKYSNYQMTDGHLLLINICEPITKNIIETLKISFPETNKPLNIVEWINQVNEFFIKTKLKNSRLKKCGFKNLSDLIGYMWVPQKYQVQYLSNSDGKYYQNSIFINTVQIINTNKSKYLIELKAKFPLLQYFGKPFGVMENMGNMDNMDNMGNMGNMGNMENMGNMDNMDNMGNMETKSKCCSGNSNNDNTGCKCGPKCKCGTNCKCGSNCKCGDHNMDNMGLQELFTYAGSISGNPIPPDADENFTLSLNPKSKYYGNIDGLLNDSLLNFTVKQEATERWIYHNLDSQDSHPFHFHMTSGFVVKTINDTSNCLLNPKFNFLNYSKDNYSIPPQQSLTFYVKFANHNSTQGHIPYLGYMYHCHYMSHHDMSMMGQFFVEKSLEKNNHCDKIIKPDNYIKVLLSIIFFVLSILGFSK